MQQKIEIIVDISKDNINPFKATQLDNIARVLEITLIDKGIAFTDYAGVASIVVAFKKSDSKCVTQIVGIPKNGQPILVPLKAQTLSRVGVLYGQISLLGANNEKIGTGKFVGTVGEDLTQTAIESSNDWGDLQKAIDLIKNADKFNADENLRIKNENIRIENEKDRILNDTQIRSQWEEVKKASQDSNIASTVVTEVISARVDKAGKTYENIGARFDNIDNDKLTTLETDAPLTKLNSVVDGNVIIDKIQGRTLVNIIKPTTLTTTSTSYSLYGVKTKLSNHGAKTMTLINSADKRVGVDIIENGSWKRNVFVDKSSTSVINLTSNEIIQAIYGFFKDGWTEENKNDLLKVMVLDGEYTGSMPSYFEGIQSVGEDNENKIEISSVGDNFWSPHLLAPYTTVVNGENKIDYKYIYSNNIKILINCFKSNTPYTMIYTAKDTKGGKNPRFQFMYTDGSEEDVNSSIPTEYTTVTKTSNASKTLSYIRTKYSLSDGDWYVKDVCIKEGTDTIYIPYQQDKSDISLSSPLRGLPNGACDEVILDSINKKLIKRTGEFTLDENNTWGKSQTDLDKTVRFAVKMQEVYAKQNYNYYSTWKNLGSTTSETDYEGSQFDKQNFHVRILKSRLVTPDVEGFKAWIKENPITVVYELAEETIEPINESLILQAFKDGHFGVNSGAITPIVSLRFPTTIGGRVDSLEESNYQLKKDYYSTLKTLIKTADDCLKLELNKVDKINGKGLSTEDFTTQFLNKLKGIATGANAYTHPSTHPASMISLNNGSNAGKLLEPVTNYKVSGTNNTIFILAGGIKVYQLNGWCGNNSSSKTMFPAGFFSSIIGVTSSGWVDDANWEELEPAAEIKIQFCNTSSVQALNYGGKPANYQLFIFGL